jgi:ferric-dicitrate binding protein FerR (iron transport regulator)
MLDEMGEFIHMVDKVYKDLHPPADLKEKITNAIQKEEIEPSSKKGRILYRLIPLAVAAVLLVGLALIFLLPKPQGFEEIPIPWEEFGKKIVLKDGSTLRITPSTSYSTPAPRKLVLNRGKAWLNIAKGKSLFRIDTPSGKIIVRGTEFVIQVLEKEKEIKVPESAVAVLVISGMVELVNRLGKELVMAGEYGYARKDSKPQKRPSAQEKFLQKNKKVYPPARCQIVGGSRKGNVEAYSYWSQGKKIY